MRARLRGRRGWILFVTSVALFAVNLTLTILVIAINPIAEDFGTSQSATAWVTLAPMVVTALFTPAAGRAADHFGRRRLWMLGMVIVTFGALASALAPSLAILIGARIVTGLGIGIVMPAGLALSTSAYPPEDRGIPVGVWAAIAGFSPAVGVIVGGVVVQFLSWRVMFFAQLPLTILAILLGLVVLDERKNPRGGRFDYEGAVVGGLAVFALMLAVNQGDDWGWTSPTTLTVFAIAVAAVPVFLWIERRAAQPVIPLAFFADRPIRWAIITRTLLNPAYMGSFIVLPFFLTDVKGWEAGLAALALAPRPFAMSVSALVAGRLTLRLDAAKLAVFGGAAITAGITMLAFLGGATGYWFLLVALLLKGAGLGFNASGTGTIATARTDEAELGTMSGVMAITQSVANSLGMAVMLSIVTSIGTSDPSAYTFSFAFGAVLAGLGFLAAVRLFRVTRVDGLIRRPRQPQTPASKKPRAAA